MQQDVGAQASPGVIEVMNRSGQVLQRVPYSGGRLSVGRAYDNDIIVGDPYVCPHHLQICDADGHLRATACKRRVSKTSRPSFSGTVF
jgi:hypothetical protein